MKAVAAEQPTRYRRREPATVRRVRCSPRRAAVRPEPPTELNGARVAEAGVRHGRSEADLVAQGRDRDSGRFLGEYRIL